MSSKKNLAAIILAAGLGTRMKSPLSKVLHKVANKTILERTLLILKDVNPTQIIIATNHKNEKKILKLTQNKYTIALQKEQKGTADALKVALVKTTSNIENLLVLYGDDNVFYRAKTLADIHKLHLQTNATITFISVKVPSPKGFGRVYKLNNKVVKIVEEKDADDTQKQIKEINDGVYFFKKSWVKKNLSKLKPSPVTGELYLTDLIELAASQKTKIETYLLKDRNEYFAISTQKDLKKAQQIFEKRIHIMGIRGAGASAITQIAQKNGFVVDGCDLLNESAYDINLEDVSINKGHNKSHINNIARLIVSPAISKLRPNNSEIQEAKKQKIKISTWQNFQGEVLQKDKFVICVAGAYGKSTTTAMIASVLKDAGLDPTCEIGATVLNWGKNYLVGKSNYYVCEADEYMDNFLNYKPDIALILNMGWDHPDYFKKLSDLENSYQKFIYRIKPKGLLIIGKDPALERLAGKIKKLKKISIEDFSPDISIIGEFRKINANAALTVAKALKINIEKAKKSIASFKGIARRLEYKGTIDKTLVYDDYAVQPYTIQETANALVRKFKNKRTRTALVLEPHTPSRVKAFYQDFINSLKAISVQKIYITDVYLAREQDQNLNLSQKMAKEVGTKAIYSGSLKNTVAILKSQIKDFQIVCSMGAGNIYKLYDLLKS